MSPRQRQLLATDLDHQNRLGRERAALRRGLRSAVAWLAALWAPASAIVGGWSVGVLACVVLVLAGWL